jgi:two-component system response regulator HydG
MPTQGVLLVSSEETLINRVRSLQPRTADLHLRVCATTSKACQILDETKFLAVLIHLALPSDEDRAVQVLAKTLPGNGCTCVALATCYRDQQAVNLLRAGFADYLALPGDMGKLAFLLEVMALRGRTGEKVPVHPCSSPTREVTGSDPAHYVLVPEMAEMMTHVRRVIPQDTTLLFTGETGTGKTHLARLVHQLSQRSSQPFLVVDCGALSPTLIESEMFGHVRGSFTGADRDREGKFSAVGEGTLILDEVNALPLPLQSKLLRAVDERVFEPVGSNRAQPLAARLIAISNSPLSQEVAAGRFRADLYYRLNVVSFYLLPLRERRAAIRPLCHKFLAEVSARNRPDIEGLSSDCLQALCEYEWPGNIRELRNVIERAVALSPGPVIQLADLPEAVRSVVYRTDGPEKLHSLNSAREEAEMKRIYAALQKHRNNRQKAAAELGISRMGLYKKMHKYGLLTATSD